jgi:hypothetical protein
VSGERPETAGTAASGLGGRRWWADDDQRSGATARFGCGGTGYGEDASPSPAWSRREDGVAGGRRGRRGVEGGEGAMKRSSRGGVGALLHLVFFGFQP